jgi:hypothetical protein
MFKRVLTSLAAAGLLAAASAGVANAWTPGDPANDLLYFRMDDRSVHHLGENQVWVEWKIKNLSNKKSDYTWTWNAVDRSTGVVLNSGTEHQNGVKPAQTVTGESYTNIVKDDTVKLVVTSLNRTVSP